MNENNDLVQGEPKEGQPDDAEYTGPAATEKKPRGRPKGYLLPTFADLQGMTLEDFSLIRGVLGGMTPREAFIQFYAFRHFDADGTPIVPHGLNLNARMDEMLAKLITAARASSDLSSAAAALEEPWPVAVDAPAPDVAKAHMEFDDWVQGQEADFYSERELIELYEQYVQEHSASAPKQVSVSQLVNKRSALVHRKISALNALQTALVVKPLPSSLVSLWFAPNLLRSFQALGIITLEQLIGYISNNGRHWHKKIRGLGPARAERIEGWLDSHSESLSKTIERTGANWQSQGRRKSQIGKLKAEVPIVDLKANDQGVYVPSSKPLAKRFGIAPLELIRVPHDLDGSTGLFRTTANHIGAGNDMEAIYIWLASYLSVEKNRTFDAYRREIERFANWCFNDAHVAISGVMLSHAMAYQAFLRAIPDRYISEARVVREDPEWRPFRGQLDPRSQQYALGVIARFYSFAVKNGYLTGNPFSSLKSKVSRSAMLDTTRSLDEQDLLWVKGCLSEMEEKPPSSPRAAAIQRRTKLILNLALKTGMRLEEIANTTIEGLRPGFVEGELDSKAWILKVIGKGRTEREIPIFEELKLQIDQHHHDALALLPRNGDTYAIDISEYQAKPPLICALRAPVGHVTADIDDLDAMSKPNLGIGKSGLYRTLKSFFTRNARAPLKAALAALEKHQAAMAKVTQGSTTQASDSLMNRDAVLRHEVRVWKRRMKVSTHWLRHTFATLLINNEDPSRRADLQTAKQLLGHTDINVTALYTRRDETAKIRAVRFLDPLE